MGFGEKKEGKKDGRKQKGQKEAEQKQRIKDSGIKYKIYLIECDSKYDKNISIIQRKTIVSSTLSILIQDINVIKTRGFSETIEYIEALYKKLINSKQFKILKVSNIYETPSYPNKKSPKFINIGLLAEYDFDKISDKILEEL